MVRKSITTPQGTMACDVCGRTLLSGEHADVFLSGGARRMVCELCVARATHEGWIREGVDDSVAVRPRADRRSFLARLRQRGEGALRDVSPARPRHDGADSPRSRRNGVELSSREIPGPGLHSDRHVVPGVVIGNPEPRHVHAVPTNADLKTARALEVFNSSDQPRVVAGVARSLGAPFVVVRPSETMGSVVSIVVGWELCWYRYEVDLADEDAGVRTVDQGDEIEQLDSADQIPNAAADRYGELHLAVTATPE